MVAAPETTVPEALGLFMGCAADEKQAHPTKMAPREHVLILLPMDGCSCDVQFAGPRRGILNASEVVGEKRAGELSIHQR